MVWLIVVVVVAVVLGLTWWTSGRARRGIDEYAVRQQQQPDETDDRGSGGDR